MFPSVGPDKEPRTKLDLARYYVAVGDALMSTVRDRPVLLERYPNGVREKSFFQKRIPDSAPGVAHHDHRRDDQRHAFAGARDRRSRPRAVGREHGRARAPRVAVPGVARPRTPTRCASTSTRPPASPSTWSARLPATSATCWPSSAWSGSRRPPAARASTSTSGSSRAGIRSPYEAPWSRSDANWPDRHPDLITDKWWKEERGTRVFVDFNQNAPHKNMFGAWGVRPRVGAQVSTPFGWDELDTIDPDAMTIDTVPARARRAGRPVGADGRRTLLDHAPGRAVRRPTSPTGSPMRRGHRCIRRCRTRHPGCSRVGPVSRPTEAPARSTTERCVPPRADRRAARRRPTQPSGGIDSSSTSVASNVAVNGSASTSVTVVADVNRCSP